MECPTQCYLCGQLFELDKLTFFTDYCECDSWMGGCTHGLCWTCNSAWAEKGEPYQDYPDDFA